MLRHRAPLISAPLTPESLLHVAKNSWANMKTYSCWAANGEAVQARGCTEANITFGDRNNRTGGVAVSGKQNLLSSQYTPSHTCAEAHASSNRLSTLFPYFPCSALDCGCLLGRLGWLLIRFTGPREGGVRSALLLRYQSCCCAYLAAHRGLQRSCWFGRFFSFVFTSSHNLLYQQHGLNVKLNWGAL